MTDLLVTSSWTLPTSDGHATTTTPTPLAPHEALVLAIKAVNCPD